MKIKWKCMICVMALFWIFCTGAWAMERYQFSFPVYAGLEGRNAGLQFDCVRTGVDGTLLVVGEDDQLLGKTKIDAGKRDGTISVKISAETPSAQKVQLWLEKGEIKELQDECLLAVDHKTSDGLRMVNTDEKKIAITFDTSLDVDKTISLLKLLEKHGVKCTFFVQGEYAYKHPDAIAAIFNAGHELANHSFTHPEMPDCTDGEIYKEIVKTNEMIEQVTGKKVVLYRPPSGNYTYRDRAISRALGCEMILWTFDSHDGFRDASRERIWKRMTENSRPGAIILMHIYGTYTQDILDEYLPLMQEEGYSFVTVSDLMLPGGAIDKNGVQSLPAQR